MSSSSSTVPYNEDGFPKFPLERGNAVERTREAFCTWYTTHQENNTLLGQLEMLECTRVARNARSSSKNMKKIL